MSRTAQEILRQLGERQPLPLLSPTKHYSPDLTREIDSLSGGTGVKAVDTIVLALHLLNDDIGRCHNIAQANEGVPTFDYLHAVLHRREKDFWNSKWWFNRIDHPLMVQLYPGASTTPQKFVDEVQRAGENKELQLKQMEEMVKIAEYALEHKI